jgi:hypothetical protein
MTLLCHTDIITLTDAVSVGLLLIPSRNCNCNIQHGPGGVFYQIQERSYKTTIYQDKITQTFSYYLNT